MRVVAQNKAGAEALIGVVLEGGEIAALGEAAVPCDEDEAPTDG
jgi:hypothetical protein